VFESEFERNLFTLRQEKLNQITALGQQTYPNQFVATHTIPQIRKEYGEATAEQLEATRVPVAIAGRIMAIRGQGKAGFATLQQGDVRYESNSTGETAEDAEKKLRLQIYVRQDAVGEQAFQLFKLLDLGDHIGVTGYLFHTRTGELSIHVETLTFLAKAMLAMPEKYHGLADVELRYRQRYVDLFANTEVRQTFIKRARILQAIRRFFDDRGYIEVETPMMQSIAGGATARPFTTHHNALDMDLFLRIAPELYLKRLVVGGFDRVYEINRNFRNEGVSTQHNPEFTMLEFYQAYANCHDLMDLTEELIIYVANEVNGTTKTTFDDDDIDLSKWEKFSMREAIIKWWPRHVSPPPQHEDFADRERFLNVLRARLSGSGEIVALEELIDPESSDAQFIEKARLNEVLKGFESATEHLRLGGQLGTAIAAVFELVAEEHLIQPTIIYDFPLAVSPLSKVKPDEPDWVERFEFYIGGFELGNAFSELNDPEDQRRRFEMQLVEREHGDDEAHQMDDDYVRALSYGLPPTAGEGIGIDRLTMILTGAKSIRDVILFPLMRPASAQSEQKREDESTNTSEGSEQK
jgi:lysyl-tRNA synthetase, class II